MVLVKPVQGLTDMLLVNMKMKTTQKNTRTAKKKALQWWTWLLDRMKAYDGLTAGSPAHVHQAPVMYEPIADPFNRLSVHISHQRAPVTTVIAIANIAILIISAIMIYTLLPLFFAKSSLQFGVCCFHIFKSDN